MDVVKTQKVLSVDHNESYNVLKNGPWGPYVTDRRVKEKL